MKKQLLLLLSIVVLGVIFVFIMVRDPNPKYEFYQGGDESEHSASITVETTSVQLELEEKMYVDVKGAVVSPGVYEVEKNFRIYDVIALAGGFTNDADVKLINLSQKIMDEMVVYVAVKGENSEEMNLHFQMMNPTVAESQGKISINRGSVEELMTLPGIGIVKAEAIVKHRTEVGEFKRIEDLLLVNGIGTKTFEGLSELIIP